MPAIAAAPIFYAALAGGAATVATGAMANRAQGKSAKRAQQYQETADTRALEEARLQREEDRMRWQADQQFQAQQWGAQEEERLFRRGIDERNLRLDDERETRRAPYRQASLAAMSRLGDILGIPMQGGGGQQQGGGGFQAPQAWLSPSNAGRPGYDPRRQPSMGAVLGMR